MKKIVLCIMAILGYFVALHAQQLNKVPIGKSEQEVMNEQKELEYFTEPGIITFQNGKWIGSDRLYNLPKNINVIVERIRTPGSKFPVEKEAVAKNVMDILKKGGFNPTYLQGGPNIPLPFFHILITTMPIPDGKVADIDIRLFEIVQLDRDKTVQGINWQAMTWERETFIQDSNENIPNKIYDTINRITQEFVDEVKRFDELKKRLE